MSSKKPHRHVWDKFFVLGIFVAFVGAGFLYLGYVFWRAQDAAVPVISKASAPSEEEYRAAMRSAAGDFLKQAVTVDSANFGSAKDDFVRLADATKARLMRIVVPSGAQSLHLQTVLLIDQWKRAADGSADDMATAPARTAELISANPWLIE